MITHGTHLAADREVELARARSDLAREQEATKEAKGQATVRPGSPQAFQRPRLRKLATALNGRRLDHGSRYRGGKGAF